MQNSDIEEVLEKCPEVAECAAGEESPSTDPKNNEPVRYGGALKRIRELEIVAGMFKDKRLRVFFIFVAFVCGFAYNLDLTIRGVYTGYATNSFSQHSLLATISVINGVVSVAAQIFFARLSDYFGRVQLFLLATLFYVIGTVIQSQSKNVHMYAAGAVFFNAGYYGVHLLNYIMLSDFSTLNWRLFCIYVPDWSFAIITWVSGNIVSASDPIKKWSWNIAMWAFIFPLASVPLLTTVSVMYLKSSKTDAWKRLQRNSEKKTTRESAKEIFWRLDIPGVMLLTIALACIFVPLTVAGGVKSKWHDSRIIGVLVLGIVLIPMFLVWEGKVSPHPMLPLSYLKDRGVWAPLLAALFIQCAYIIAQDYMYPLLLVAFDESETSATRIVSLPSFSWAVVSPFVGLIVVKYRKIKAIILVGCSLFMISMGLFYHFRGGDNQTPGAIAGSVFLGAAIAICTYLFNVGLQSTSSHDQMAVITGCFFSFGKVGFSLGSAISGAIWTQVMYPQIAKRIPDPSVALEAYATPYNFVRAYPWGTPERLALVEAYKYVQRILMIVGLVFTIPLFIMALLMRDVKLSTTDVAPEVDENGNVIIHSEDDPIYENLKKMFNAVFRRRSKTDEQEQVPY